MTLEMEAFERLIIIGKIPPTECFSPGKANEAWYSTTLKQILKELEQKTSASKQLKTSAQTSYSQLVAVALEALISGNLDTAMRFRAELMGQFRLNHAQVEAALFKKYTCRQTGPENSFEPECVDLSRLGGMDFLVDGFVPANDQTLLYGKAGCCPVSTT
jgi:hypothetical protein